MGSLNLVTTIVDRKIIHRYMDVYQANDLQVAFLALGYGTASNEILDYLGLESNSAFHSSNNLRITPNWSR